jgi:FkbM family methyltransferase
MAVIDRLLRRLGEEERPVRFLASRVLWHSGLSRYLMIRRSGDRGRYRIRFFPTAVSSQVWVYPERVSEEEAFVARTLRPGDTYVDIGGNIGLLALRAASVVGAGGKVIVVEAHPRIAGFLRENVRLNNFSHVSVEHVAVGEASGEITFSDRRSDDQNGVVADGSGAIHVPMVTLDELLPTSRASRIALLKLDVEGFELAVLRGAKATLTRVDRVLFECDPDLTSRYGHSSREILDLLRSAGFVPGTIDGEEYPPDYEPASFGNVLALRRSPGVADPAT